MTVRNKINFLVGALEPLLATVKRGKLAWFGHVTRRDNLSKSILQGTLQGVMNQQAMGDVSLPPNMQLDTQSTAKQFYEFLAQYNRVSEMCFNHCVHDFTTRKVLDAENTCAVTCLEKFMKSVSRISLRFQEIQFAQSGSMAPALATAETMKK